MSTDSDSSVAATTTTTAAVCALNLFAKRRTQYALLSDLPIEKDEVEIIIKTAVRQSPSSFNSQSSRAVILWGKEHLRLWNGITLEALRPFLTTPEQLNATETKLAGFAAGAGTVLFFEDQNVIKDLQERFPLYADKFPEFSANSAGMAQFAVWTALAEAGIGASLQHYHPVIDTAVQDAWQIPQNWRLSAQMPFGGHGAEIGAKSYIDDSQRFRSIS